MAWQLDRSSLEALALGGLLRGGGGGGDTDAATIGHVQSVQPVPVLALTELDAQARVCAVAQIGAPLIGRERAPSAELRDVVEALAHETGEPFHALVTLEIGGQNAITAVAAARQTGLPLVDADLMGRALPRIDQTLAALHGIGAAPVALASPSGHVVVVRRAGDGDVEGLTRAMLPSLGGRAAAALYATTAGELGAAGTAGAVSGAVALGAALLAASRTAARDDLGSRTSADLVRDALGPLGLEVLTDGTVRHVERSGPHVVAAVVGHAGVARLDADTEIYHCTLDGRPAAAAPDVIGVLDARTLRPVLIANLRAGAEVVVYRLPVPEPWYTSDGRALVERGRPELAA